MGNYRRVKEKQKKGHRQLSVREGDVYALIYCRVSSDRQASEGHGLESQELRCREFVERKGYLIAEVFKDAATGAGGYTTRPGQVELIKYIEKFPHRNFVVVVDDSARLARDVQGHIQVRAILKGLGVSVESPNFNFEDSPEGGMVEVIIASVNQYHRQGNARQVIQKTKARLESGYWAFGSKKGYSMVKDPAHGKIAVPNREGLEMLKPALESFANDTFVRRIDVCRFLVERGFWKKQRPDRYIDKLTNFMLDPFYCGDLSYPRWEVARRKGHHKGIISVEIFERIQLKLQKENVGARIRTDASADFPLRGLLVCALCKKHLTAAWARKKFPYYFCQNVKCELHNKTFRRDNVESDFRTVLESISLKGEIYDLAKLVFGHVWSEQAKSMRERAILRTQEAVKLSEKVKGFSEMLLNATGKPAVVQRAIEGQLEETAEELERIEREIAGRVDPEAHYRTAFNIGLEMLRNPIKIWDSLDIKEKHKLFFFIFESKLEYAKEGGYRTAESLCRTRLFEDFAAQNPLDVEVRRVELRSESGFEDESTTHS